MDGKQKGNAALRVTDLTIISILSLTACSSAPLPPRNFVQISLAQGDLSRVDLALEQTVTALVGPTNPDDGGDGGLISQIPSDVLTRKRSSRTPLHRNRVRSIGIAVGQAVPLSHRWEITNSLSLSHAQSTYSLPHGAGILTDPITLAFATTALSAETEAGWAVLPNRRYSPRLTVGGGAVVMFTKTRINSALLAVQHNSRHTDWFATLGIQQPLYVPPQGQGPRLVLDATARVYEQDRASYHIATRLRF